MAKEKNQTPKGIHSPSDLGDRIPIAALLSPEVEVGSFLTNADIDSPEGREVIYAANRPSDIGTEEMLGQTIDVKYWVCKKDELESRGGGGKDTIIRTTVIDPEGRTFSCTSTGVAKSIDLLRQFFPDAPINPPYRMRLQATDLGKGADFLMLVPVHMTENPSSGS